MRAAARAASARQGAAAAARGGAHDVGVTGFFTDPSICIGCKACEVACKEWNGVPEDGLDFSGFSYDNTRALGHSTWRHVKFIEQQPAADEEPFRWIFLSDVCKH